MTEQQKQAIIALNKAKNSISEEEYFTILGFIVDNSPIVVKEPFISPSVGPYQPFTITSSTSGYSHVEENSLNDGIEAYDASKFMSN